MANQRKVEEVFSKRRPRRTQNIDLTDDQISSLVDLWKNYHGGTREFAMRMVQIEHPHSEHASYYTLTARMKSLHRIEDRQTGVSPAMFSRMADVLKLTAAELKAKISTPSPSAELSHVFGPWITDEAALAPYRTSFHIYNIRRLGADYFWTHDVIDFSDNHSGYLRAVLNAKTPGAPKYHVYGYLFGEMLITLIKPDKKESLEREATCVYHDFRRILREHAGHSGVQFAEDFNGDFGVGGSLLLRQPFPGTRDRDRQSSAVNKRLTKYWKDLGGERYNPMLHLFSSKTASVVRRK